MATLNDFYSQLIALNQSVLVIQTSQQETNNLLKDIVARLEELIQVTRNK
jgi:hypothetical protein